jgi:hypothetical protein
VTRQIASEAAIATALHSAQIVATYSHDVRSIGGGVGQELGVHKLYLVQVRLFCLKLLAEQLCFCLVQNHHTTDYKYNQSKIDKHMLPQSEQAHGIPLSHIPGLLPRRQPQPSSRSS